MVKVAFLIIAHDNYIHLERLIEALNHENASFFIHVNRRSSMPVNIQERENLAFIKRIDIWWGGWSMTQATLNLLKESAKCNFDYYFLLSGTDYPIRPNSELYQKLAEGGEYINIIKGFQKHKPESRIKHYYLEGFNRRNKKSLRTLLFSTIESLLRYKNMISKKSYPFDSIYHGSFWFALSHECITYILNYIDKHPEYVKFFKTSLFPDESFFHTIIGNSTFFSKCRGNLTYTDWSDNNTGPAIISKKHLQLFESNKEFETVYGKHEPFVARKFTDNHLDIIKEIDAKLR